MKKLLSSNELLYRLLRTIIQGVIGVIVANLDLLFGFFSIPAEVKAILVAVVMAVLSPIMAELGKQHNGEATTDDNSK